MKKIIAAFFLLTCGLVVFLATVDLEPYLSSGPPEVPEEVNLPPLREKDKLPAKTESTAEAVTQLATQQEDLLVNKTPSTIGKEMPIEQEPATTPPADLNDNVELEQIPPAMIKMEITVLPVGEYPYSILLETFLKPELARQALLTYQERGISAYWVKVNLGNEVIRYRVFTGTFSTAADAQLYLEQHQLSGKLIRLTNYSARVGIYNNKPQLITDFIKTRETGVVPYILRTNEDSYYLYVGAFYTYRGAVVQCHSLIKSGLGCKPVKRSTLPSEEP